MLGSKPDLDCRLNNLGDLAPVLGQLFFTFILNLPLIKCIPKLFAVYFHLILEYAAITDKATCYRGNATENQTEAFGGISPDEMQDSQWHLPRSSQNG